MQIEIFYCLDENKNDALVIYYVNHPAYTRPALNLYKDWGDNVYFPIGISPYSFQKYELVEPTEKHNHLFERFKNSAFAGERKPQFYFNSIGVFEYIKTIQYADYWGK